MFLQVVVLGESVYVSIFLFLQEISKTVFINFTLKDFVSYSFNFLLRIYTLAKNKKPFILKTEKLKIDKSIIKLL